MRYLLSLLLSMPILSYLAGQTMLTFFSTLALWMFYIGCFTRKPSYYERFPCAIKPRKLNTENGFLKKIGNFNSALANNLYAELDLILSFITRGVTIKSSILRLVCWWCGVVTSVLLVVNIWHMTFTIGMPYNSSGYPPFVLQLLDGLDAVLLSFVYGFILLEHVSSTEIKFTWSSLVLPFLVLALPAFVVMELITNEIKQSDLEWVSNFQWLTDFNHLPAIIVAIFIVNPVLSLAISRYIVPVFKKDEHNSKQETTFVSSLYSSMISVPLMLGSIVTLGLFTNLNNAMFNPDYSYLTAQGKKAPVELVSNGIDGQYMTFDPMAFKFSLSTRKNYTIEGQEQLSHPFGLTHAYYEARNGAFYGAVLFANMTDAVPEEHMKKHFKRLQSIYRAVDYEMTDRVTPADSLSMGVQENDVSLSQRLDAKKKWAHIKEVEKRSVDLAAAGNYEAFWAHYELHRSVLDMSASEKVSKGMPYTHTFTKSIATILYRNGYMSEFTRIPLRNQHWIDENTEYQREKAAGYQYLDNLDERYRAKI